MLETRPLPWFDIPKLTTISISNESSTIVGNKKKMKKTISTRLSFFFFFLTFEYHIKRNFFSERVVLLYLFVSHVNTLLSSNTCLVNCYNRG